MIDNNNPQTVLHCGCPPNPTKRKKLLWGANTHLVARLSLFYQNHNFYCRTSMSTPIYSLAQLSGCLGT